MSQISLFDGASPLKITKPIRLIECFAGYGSQALSLKYLGVPFEHWRIAEWAVKSIQAYKDMHFPGDDTDYSKEHSTDWLIEYLFNKGISADYNKPMTKAQITRMGENKIRTVYNNIIATNNLVSVTNVRGEDLNIADTDRYTYILTYSFPCQDLSNAGLGKGMAKGSGTRSGLLWEIERILDECAELPQILLMENVPDVIGKKNFAHFTEWYGKLESLGYKSWYKVMNAKEYGMPQNRERCFMVSALGDHYYEFPKTVPLELRLKDLLEPEVDEKYYLKTDMIEYFRKHSAEQEAKGNGFRFAPTDADGIGKAITTRAGGEWMIISSKKYSVVKLPHGYFEGGIYDDATICPTIDTGVGCWHVLIGENMEDIKCDQVAMLCGDNHEVKIEILDEQNGYIRQDGTVGTIMTDGNSPKHNNRVIVWDGYNQQIRADSSCVGTLTRNYGADLKRNGQGIVEERRIRKLTPRECFRLMGVKDKDFERVAASQSDSSLYHLAGDSIVTNCLMAIFKEML